jgi:hypothetical protein
MGPHWAAHRRTRLLTRFLRYGFPSYRRPRARSDEGPPPGTSAYDPGVPVAVLLVFLLAGLLALIPVWRLRVAGWPPAWLFASWVTYAVLILLVMRFAAVTRFVLPVLVILYVAPFVAGPERLARLLGRRAVEPPRPVIDVTPKPPPAIPPARRKRSSGRTLHADPPGGEVIEVSEAPIEVSEAPIPDEPDDVAQSGRDAGVAS